MSPLKQTLLILALALIGNAKMASSKFVQPSPAWDDATPATCPSLRAETETTTVTVYRTETVIWMKSDCTETACTETDCYDTITETDCTETDCYDTITETACTETDCTSTESCTEDSTCGLLCDPKATAACQWSSSCIPIGVTGACIDFQCTNAVLTKPPVALPKYITPTAASLCSSTLEYTSL